MIELDNFILKKFNSADKEQIDLLYELNQDTLKYLGNLFCRKHLFKKKHLIILMTFILLIIMMNL